ncbi:hypothetical protein EV649_5051 [Kribbella sp. VKM Ac-2569]|uniref:hypothetical protein n=1 Tax=Kribbella sp. VKM Ac-2569 TaxID=2512220 RepID=UPI00102BC8CF|nr:hypothetical protein [Kribbella sp. VKM Ac-2569]RZT17504.1 hypothetical protein EV649_5051 [Kribbella sp. VKM Ac-2569]
MRDARVVMLILAAVCAAGVIALAIVRIRACSWIRRPIAQAWPVDAVARTHFIDGGGYVEIDGVIGWATADPAARILPGHVLSYEPDDGGYTVAPILGDDSASGSFRA